MKNRLEVSKARENQHSRAYDLTFKDSLAHGLDVRVNILTSRASEDAVSL